MKVKEIRSPQPGTRLVLSEHNQAARLGATHLQHLGMTLTGPELYDTYFDESLLRQYSELYRTLPKDPRAPDKHRCYARFIFGDGRLERVNDTDYSQPSNSTHPGARGFAAASQEMTSHPVTDAVLRGTLELGVQALPELMNGRTTIGLHWIEYRSERFGSVSMSSPPYGHRDSESLANVALIDVSENSLGGDNYIALGGDMPNVGFRLTKPLHGFAVLSDCLHGVTPFMQRPGSRLRAYRRILIATIEPAL